jgi:NAD(P)H dehydrogenase (quinone)
MHHLCGTQIQHDRFGKPVPAFPDHALGRRPEGHAMQQDFREVVITGATGGLGSDIIGHLQRFAPPSELGVSIRAPEKAKALSDAGIRVRRGDFSEPASLDLAFQGARRVLLISTRTPGNAARFQEQRNAIDAAIRCGVEHIFYTSIVQRPGSVFDVVAGHHDTEAYLASCGAACTVLRNGQYIENLPMFLGQSIFTGDLALPKDGPTAWVSRLDLAEGIARLLLKDTPLPESILLTGPEALDFAEIAEIASRALGHTIVRRVVSRGEFSAGLIGRGFPPQLAQSLVTGFASRAAGELAETDPALQLLLGRPLRRVAEVLPELLARTTSLAPAK